MTEREWAEVIAEPFDPDAPVPGGHETSLVSDRTLGELLKPRLLRGATAFWAPGPSLAPEVDGLDDPMLELLLEELVKDHLLERRFQRGHTVYRMARTPETIDELVATSRRSSIITTSQRGRHPTQVIYDELPELGLHYMPTDCPRSAMPLDGIAEMLFPRHTSPLVYPPGPITPGPEPCRHLVHNIEAKLPDGGGWLRWKYVYCDHDPPSLIVDPNIKEISP